MKNKTSGKRFIKTRTDSSMGIDSYALVFCYKKTCFQTKPVKKSNPRFIFSSTTTALIHSKLATDIQFDMVAFDRFDGMIDLFPITKITRYV